MISADVTVARLLQDHPELLDVLEGYHPHFKALRNTLLRRIMAPRVNVAQAARIAGVDPQNLLSVLRRAAGEPDSPPGGGGDGPRATSDGGSRPAALIDVPASRLVHIDVRDDIRLGREPIRRIIKAVKALQPDQVLMLRAPFEPIPLYELLGKWGFAHWAKRQAADDWSVWFYRANTGRREVTAGGAASDSVDSDAVVDVRGLEPPQPMVRVLEALDRLAPGARLEVLHERRPIFLYPQLDERGFSHETEEPEPGLVRIVIRKRPPRT